MLARAIYGIWATLCTYRESRGHIDGVGDALDGEWTFEASIEKVLSAIIEDEVDTSELLQRLQKTASDETLEHGALEAVCVCSFAETQFVAMVGFDFRQLLEDAWVVGWHAAELAESLCRFVVPVSLDEVSRSFRKHDEPESSVRVGMWE